MPAGLSVYFVGAIHLSAMHVVSNIFLLALCPIKVVLDSSLISVGFLKCFR